MSNSEKQRLQCLLTLFEADDYSTITFKEVLDFCICIEHLTISELHCEARKFIICYNDILSKTSSSKQNAAILNQKTDNSSIINEFYNVLEKKKIDLVFEQKEANWVEWELFKKEVVEAFLISIDVKKIKGYAQLSRRREILNAYGKVLTVIGENADVWIDHFKDFAVPIIDILNTFNKQNLPKLD